MSKIRQILRMYSQGRSKLSIATHTGVSRNTVKIYLTAFLSSGCSFEQINSLDDKELDDFFGKNRERVPNSRLLALQRCFPRVDRELKRTGVTRMMLWESYIKEFPDGFQYTQFCFYYNQWKSRVNPVMHLDHKAGDKLFIDFAGQKLSIADRDSGEIIQVEVFVAILAASQLTYVEAVMSQQKEDFISACENTLHHLGGVPAAIVPDNLKAAVTKSSRYGPTPERHICGFCGSLWNNHPASQSIPSKGQGTGGRSRIAMNFVLLSVIVAYTLEANLLDKKIPYPADTKKALPNN